MQIFYLAKLNDAPEQAYNKGENWSLGHNFWLDYPN